MAPRVQLKQVYDFTGGVNYRDDAFQLPERDLADSNNIRILADGGVERRKTLHYVNSTDLSNNPKNLWSFLGNGVKQIVVQDGNDAAYSTGGNFTAINPDALTLTGMMRADSMARVSVATSDALYVCRNAEQVAWKWSGSAATVLADTVGAYNDVLGTPNYGNFPKGKYCLSHAGFMFVANTVESGTAYPFRVRFSHPGEPEDYQTLDYFDVGAEDGDAIVGLAPLGDQLLIFKSRSIWSLSGDDGTNFLLAKVIDGVGAVSQEAIAPTPSGVFFFDGTNGVYLLGATSLTIQERGSLNWLWKKMVRLLQNGALANTYVGGVTLAWMDNRLWLSAPLSGSTVNNTMYVYDPNISRDGGWMQYRYGYASLTQSLGPMLEWRPDTTTRLLLGVAANAKKVHQLDYDTGANDIFATSGLLPEQPYESWFRTAWFSVGLPGVKKRFRRPTFVFDADNDYTVGLQVFTDYNSLTAARNQSLSVAGVGSGGGNWGSFNWGAANWGVSGSGQQAIVRGTGIGNANAVQLLFTGPSDEPWGLNAIEFRYLVRTIR